MHLDHGDHVGEFLRMNHVNVKNLSILGDDVVNRIMLNRSMNANLPLGTKLNLVDGVGSKATSSSGRRSRSSSSASLGSGSRLSSSSSGRFDRSLGSRLNRCRINRCGLSRGLRSRLSSSTGSLGVGPSVGVGLRLGAGTRPVRVVLGGSRQSSGNVDGSSSANSVDRRNTRANSAENGGGKSQIGEEELCRNHCEGFGW